MAFVIFKEPQITEEMETELPSLAILDPSIDFPIRALGLQTIPLEL